MFKRSAPINPQALRNDYTGIERAAAIKQKTLADLGGVISDGFKSFQKKKEDKLKKESALKVIRKYGEMSGNEMTDDDIKGIYGNLDAETILQQGEILRDLAQYEQREKSRLAQEEAMRKAAKRANQIAQARNEIAKKQAAASRMNAKKSLLGARAGERRDREEFKAGKKHDRATSASIEAMNITDAEGNRVTPSLGAALDEYKKQGGNKPSEFAGEFYSTFPGAKRYTAKYTDDQGNEKTVLFINGQRIDKDDRSTALRSFDSLLEGKDSKGEPLFTDEEKDAKRKEFAAALTSKGGSGGDPIDAMIARVIEPILKRKLGESIPSEEYRTQ